MSSTPWDCKEPTSIKGEDIEVGAILVGDYAGSPYIWLKENYARQKGQALTLMNPDVDAENTNKKTFLVNSVPFLSLHIKLLSNNVSQGTVQGRLH